MIKTSGGEVPAENIQPGMRVLTRDNGYQPVVWTGARSLDADELYAAPHLVPVRISAGALGPDLPERDLDVSPQHRMLLSNLQIRKWFQSDEVLIAAMHMTCYPGISIPDVETVHYIHFMFAQHEIVLANGCWSESFQPTDMSAGAMGEAHRREILELFPELNDVSGQFAAARETADATIVPDLLNAVLKASHG